MVSTRSMERMTEADKAMLLLCLQREMVEMKRKTEEATQKNEQEIQALRRKNEEMKKKLMEGEPSAGPTNVAAGPTPPLPTRDRWRRQETRSPPMRWMTNPVSTSRLGRPPRWTRPADTLSPMLSLKFHCRTSGKVSIETDTTGLLTRMSIWTPTLPT